MFRNQFPNSRLVHSILRQTVHSIGEKITSQLVASSTDFNRDQALQMACLCRAASLASDHDILSARQILNSAIFESNYQIESYLYADIPFAEDQSSCYGILVNHPKYAIVALRGTRHLNDWLFNFLANANINEIHSGIAHLTNCLWQPLVKFITKPDNQNKQIILAGHSLGGAVATLMTHHLHQDYFHLKLITYTFGAPPISSRSLNVGNRFFRLRTTKDIIPDLFKVLGKLEGLLPFTNSLSSYKHSGQEYLVDDRYQITLITGGTHLAIQQLALLAQALSNQYKQSANKFEAIASDHHLNRYIELLNHGSLPVGLFL
jgi:triacylglycerol lipase